MIRRATLSGLVLAILALGVVSADALFLIQGSLRGDDPMGVAGLITLVPSSDTSVALLQFAEGTGGDRPTLFRADRVRLEVVRTVDDPLQPKLRGGAPSQVRQLDVTHAELQLESLTALGQALVYDKFLREAPGTIAASTTDCQVWDPPDDERIVFPQDPDKVGTYMSGQRLVGRQQLEAACRASGATTDQARLVSLYGMDLHLRSSETEEVIRTGTFEEAYAERAPLTRKVTQILQVERLDAPLHVELPMAAEARLYAHEFLAVGELHVGPSEGALLWGGVSKRGPIDSFGATGEFRLKWSEDRFVVIDGSTLHAPPFSTASLWTKASDAPLVLASLVGLGLLALLLRLLWPLFTKLSPDQVLEHPRRARILEYVRTQPGVEANTVARSLGLRWANLVYHLGTLARGGHVTIRRVGGRTAIFPANMGYRGREEVVALLRRDTLRLIHERLREQPGLDQEALAEGLRLTQQRISQSLRVMERAGLVRFEVANRRRRYYAGAVAA